MSKSSGSGSAPDPDNLDEFDPDEYGSSDTTHLAGILLMTTGAIGYFVLMFTSRSGVVSRPLVGITALVLVLGAALRMVEVYHG